MSDLDKEELEATRNIGKTADETENEIEKIIQFMIEDNYNISFISSIRSLMALYKTYLSLYNKEKEKNKRYEKYLKTKEKKYEKILEYIETEIEQDYISKDKVKECLDDIIDYFDNPSIPDEDNQFLEKKKKELLEEEE